MVLLIGECESTRKLLVAQASGAPRLKPSGWYERISITDAEIRISIQLHCPSGIDGNVELVIFHPEIKLVAL